jgi:hypothetical protein
MMKDYHSLAYMQVGGLYCLSGLTKNKTTTCMAMGYHTPDDNTAPFLTACQRFGWPGPNKRRFTDGDVFVCLEVVTNEDTGHVNSYVVLTPDGRRAKVWHQGNKTKFKKATLRK